MTRAMALSGTVTWWPSTLYQTTTLEFRRDARRLLVDPGISPWEIEEIVAASADPVTDVLLTHADWDHVLGIPALPDATVWGSRVAAERIATGEAAESLVNEAAEFCVEYADLAGLRIDRVVETPAELTMGAWPVACRAGNGHTPDGLVTWFADESVLVVGDYLSAIEIPWSYSSVTDYRDTLQMLTGLIEQERPNFVVGGHGRPNHSDAALRIAAEDLAYLESVLAFVAAGGTPEEVDKLTFPVRNAGSYGASAHAANIKLAYEAATA